MKPIPHILALFFLAIALGSFVGCTDRKVNPEALVDDHKQEKPAFVFKDMVSLYSENGVVRIRRATPTMLRYENGDERYPDGLDITLYNEKGQKTTTLVSNSGSFKEQEKTYQAVGDVVVINTEKMQRLETPILNWTQESQEIFTDTTVVITTETEQLNGIGLFAKHDFSEYRVVEATGIVQVDGFGKGFDIGQPSKKTGNAQQTEEGIKKTGAKSGINKTGQGKGKSFKGKKKPVKKKPTKAPTKKTGN